MGVLSPTARQRLKLRYDSRPRARRSFRYYSASGYHRHLGMWGVCGFAFEIAPWFTITALAAGIVLLFLLRAYSTRSLAERRESMVNAGDLAALTAEHLAGTKVAKGYRAEERHVEAFSAADERLLRAYLRMARGFHVAEFWRQLCSAMIFKFGARIRHRATTPLARGTHVASLLFRAGGFPS